MSVAQLRRPDQASHLIIRTKGELYAVYEGNRFLRILSRVTTYLAKKHNGRLAKQCTRLLHRVNRVGGAWDLAWSAPSSAVRQALEQLFRTHYGVHIKASVQTTQLVCQPKPASPASTVITVLYQFRVAFDALISLKLRIDHPLDTVRCATRQLRQHQSVLRQGVLYDGTQSRTPVGYYRIQNEGVTPQGILDNPGLPGLLRQAARAGGWQSRDLAVLELLLCSGARVAEVCGMTWASLASADGHIDLRLHTKGQGLVPRKPVVLSSEAKRALLTYLQRERPTYDEHHGGFTSWLGRRQWTPERYLEYLRAQQIDPATVPVFLTHRKTAHNPDAFQKAAWSRLRRPSARGTACGQLLISPHHIRHWVINADLDRIWAAHGQEEFRSVEALRAYVQDMGWRSWRSLQHYDHRGAVTFLMQAWTRALEGKAAPAVTMNGLLDQLQADGTLPPPVSFA
ncbi:hypothetical protein M8445_17585 (plasmid) [Deinococcus aquaticus]|uniref:Tyr recombinase domain-containing protein n=1 Tax=Deinococcus aquaticus TaxID=328692 RepID=A0ABY7V606_9DEIO|nr:hypothetical protein [Deinococcus aquaticus]WDA60550.1 hypothetical protein M8445_17585 [Deinococcus aquaticus]